MAALFWNIKNLISQLTVNSHISCVATSNSRTCRFDAKSQVSLQLTFTLMHFQACEEKPGGWIKTLPLSLVWLFQWRWLTLIGYHNTGIREEKRLPQDTCCRRPFNPNYMKHISRLTDKLTSVWSKAMTEPQGVTGQVL